MVKDSPWFGVGLNNFVYRLPKISRESGNIWMFQPVHNMSLLVFTEAGLFGLFIFYAIIYHAIKRRLYDKRIISRNIALILITVITLGVADHYFLTLQQNQLMFAIILGLSFKKNLV
jgi:O-antigen ligase